MKRRIKAQDAAVRGFNLGANAGEAAGQTVMHQHVHLIPRRHGDIADPRGGVRRVIPGKGRYSLEDELGREGLRAPDKKRGN